MSLSSGGSGGSGGRDPFAILQSTRSFIQQMGWTGLGQTAIGTFLLATLFGGIDLLNALLNVPISALNAIATIIPAINEATFLGLGGFLEGALGAAAAAFGSGWTGLLGPFQGPFGVGLFLIMLWEVLYFLDVVDSDFLGFVIDLPDFILNSDDSGVADEDE